VKRYAKWIFGGVAVVAVLLQLKKPVLTNPPVEPGGDLLATNAPPAEITAVLRAACYDCHSYETKWPWYSHVAPVSWWIADHVVEARDRLNFSDWPHDSPENASAALEHINKEVRSGRMPLPSYTWIHAQSRLTTEQRKQLADWAEQQALRLDTSGAGAKQP
jgi:Haem-binding domain